MSKQRQALGAWGERQAARWYRDQGYSVLDQNWRTRQGELDLICQRGELLVFCEVKTRSSTAFGLPEEAVTYAKQRRIRSLAFEWLSQHQVYSPQLRFDVAAVLGNQIRVLEAAF